MAGEVERQARRDRVRQLPRAGERPLRGLQARVGKPEHPQREGQVVQDVHPVVHAGREDVLAVLARVVEAERRLERRPGGDELPLVEQGDPGHEMADRQGDRIAGAPDRGARAVRQLPRPPPLARDVGDPPQAAEGVDQLRGRPEPLGQLDGAGVDRLRLRGREPSGRPDRRAERELQVELPPGARVGVGQGAEHGEPSGEVRDRLRVRRRLRRAPARLQPVVGGRRRPGPPPCGAGPAAPAWCPRARGSAPPGRRRSRRAAPGGGS